jgi:hypothetical protein
VKPIPSLEKFEHIPCFHTYSSGHAYLFILLVLSACSSLRGAGRILKLIMRFFEIDAGSPSWYTGRLWLLRLGYYKLTRPKERSDDWIWIVDHTIQWGKEKCLAIFGIRQSQLPKAETILCFEDVEPLALLPVTHSNGEIVYRQLEDTVSKTGVPRQIISDHGTDVKSGIERFCRKHPRTCFIYDIKHKVAAVLKHELGTDNRWQEFIKLAARTRKKVQQTDLAVFAPPNQRTKARYMNVAELVKWALEKLIILDHHPSIPDVEYDLDHLISKLGWLTDYRSDLAKWQELIRIVGEAESFIKFQGIYQDCQIDLMQVPTFEAKTPQARLVREKLLDFIEQEANKARTNERLLGSSEIIESAFGKLKNLERDQSKSGFTVFILSLAAVVSETTMNVVSHALESVPTKKVFEWFKENVGQSLQAKRVALNSLVKNVEQKWDQNNMVLEG